MANPPNRHSLWQNSFNLWVWGCVARMLLGFLLGFSECFLQTIDSNVSSINWVFTTRIFIYFRFRDPKLNNLATIYLRRGATQDIFYNHYVNSKILSWLNQLKPKKIIFHHQSTETRDNPNTPVKFNTSPEKLMLGERFFAFGAR